MPIQKVFFAISNSIEILPLLVSFVTLVTVKISTYYSRSKSEEDLVDISHDGLVLGPNHFHAHGARYLSEAL